MAERYGWSRNLLCRAREAGVRVEDPALVREHDGLDAVAEVELCRRW
jgi:hypothetical protein